MRKDEGDVERFEAFFGAEYTAASSLGAVMISPSADSIVCCVKQMVKYNDIMHYSMYSKAFLS